MSGLALRAAARLMETRGPNRLLYEVAARQLGLSRLHEEEIPPEVPPFQPLHLGGRGSGGRNG